MIAAPLIWFALVVVGLVMIYDKKTSEHTVSGDFFAHLLLILLFYWGGLFDSFHWADLVVVGTTAYNFGRRVVSGDTVSILTTKTKVFSILMTVVRGVALYYGGFFDGLLGL